MRRQTLVKAKNMNSIVPDHREIQRICPYSKKALSETIPVMLGIILALFFTFDGEPYSKLRTTDPAMGGSHATLYVNKEHVAKVIDDEKLYEKELIAYRTWGDRSYFVQLEKADNNTLVMEKAAGISLNEMIAKKQSLANVVIAIAETLSEMHQT